MSVRLRKYQLLSIARAMSEAPGNRLLMVGPTGCGKTVIAAGVIKRHLAESRRNRVLFVAGRSTIVRQTFEQVRAQLPRVRVGVIMAAVEQIRNDNGVDWRDRVDPAARVQVAGVLTLANRDFTEATMVIVDEAHHATSETYAALLDSYSDAVVIGFTATPHRKDGQPLGDVFGDLYAIAAPSELVRLGWLSKPEVWGAPRTANELRQMRLKGLKVSGGDYQVAALGSAMNHRTLVGHIVDEWKRLGQGLPTVAFASSVGHSKAIVTRFKRAGIAAEHIDGETREAERVAILERLEAGTTKVVSNYDVLGEGWDMPAVKCMIMARPTRSETVYLQRAGRVLRPFEGQRPIIIDHGGCAVRFGLPDMDREHTLDGKAVQGGPKDAPCKQCPECYAIVAAGDTRCECGYAWPAVVDPEEAAAELRRIEARGMFERIAKAKPPVGMTAREWVDVMVRDYGAA